jgi:hypothetical protein
VKCFEQFGDVLSVLFDGVCGLKTPQTGESGCTYEFRLDRGRWISAHSHQPSQQSRQHADKKGEKEIKEVQFVPLEDELHFSGGVLQVDFWWFRV